MAGFPNRSFRLGAIIAGAAVVVVAAVVAMQSDAAGQCGMQMGGTPAFCETFDAPVNKPGRSGDLDETIWGVSRVGDANLSPQLANSVALIASPCGGSPEAWPVRICNGQMVTTVDDHEGVANLATYPKQPFDFAGRTGTVSFDVSNDTQGNHMAWPEFWITTKPTPAPMDFFSDHYTTPEFGLGIQFDNTCGDAGIIDVVANYNITAASRTRENCIGMSNGTTMNHYEIRISQTQVEVWGSDAGSTTLKRLNVATVNLQFTRGLVWLDQVHYNACKTPGTQCRHSFRWDNLAFDGPYTYNDLTYDVLDNTVVIPDGRVNLGWYTASDNNVTLSTLPLPSQSVIDTATGAFVLFNNYLWNESSTITFVVNGNANVVANPFAGGGGFARHTLYFPVPKAQLLPNVANTVRIYGTSGMNVYNVNLLLVAAVTGGPTSTPTATSTPTSSPTATPPPSTATSTPTASATATPTPTSTSTPTTIPTSTPSPFPTPTSTVTPTSTPTATPSAQVCRLSVRQPNGTFVNVNGTLQPFGTGKVCVVP